MEKVDLDACARRLRFSAALEIKFREQYYRNCLAVCRTAIVVTVFLWMAFGILDYFVLPLSYRQVWVVRFAVIAPILLSVLVLSYLPVFRKMMQAGLFHDGFGRRLWIDRNFGDRQAGRAGLYFFIMPV